MPWHGFQQQLKCFPESHCSCCFPFVVAETNYHEIVRRHDHGCLAAGDRNVIGVPWDGILAETIDPEEAAVNGEIIAHPCRRWCADEFHVTLWQNALAVPDAILKIKVAQPRPVPAAANLIALSQKIPEWISF